MNEAILDVQARMNEIQTRFMPSLPAVTSTSTANGVNFEELLNEASGSFDSASGDAVVAAAKKYLGIPYKWGGTDPKTGMDCSGFVQRVYKDLGIDLPRVSRDQARAGSPVATLADAKPGDLIALDSRVKDGVVDHIGIYVGDGNMIVAPKTGDVVKIQKITQPVLAIRRIVDGDGAPAAAKTASGSMGLKATSFDELFSQAGRKHGIDPKLLKAVAQNESGFNPNAKSPAGALGLMQIMPGTAKGLGVNPMNPAEAIDGAARLLAQNKRAFGTNELALAAYNAGGGAVSKYGGIPPYKETQNYVRKVLATYNS